MASGSSVAALDSGEDSDWDEIEVPEASVAPVENLDEGHIEITLQASSRQSKSEKEAAKKCVYGRYCMSLDVKHAVFQEEVWDLIFGTARSHRRAQNPYHLPSWQRTHTEQMDKR